MLNCGFAECLYRGLSLSFKAQCLRQIEGGLCLLGGMLLHRHRAINWYAFGVDRLNSRGVCLF